MSLRWKKISEKVVKINRFRTMVIKRFRLPHGYVGKFYIQGTQPVVCALVVTKTNKVVLAKQFRAGPEVVMWELPGGWADGDTPRQGALREVLEETGYRGKIQFLAKTTNNAWTGIWRYHYLMTEAVKVAEPHPDPAEAIEVVEVSFKKFRELLKTGKFTDSETAYRGLEALGRFRFR